jgi:hypothetical protein
MAGGGSTGVMHPADDPGWSSYAETILVVHGNVPVEVPLSRPIGARERAVFVAAGLPGAFGLMTAENPCGQPLGPEENAARRRRLQAELAAQGETPVRIDGLSPDRQHREIGVALRWSCEAVVALARRWEQSAIYWFDGHNMWVVGALTITPPWKLEPQ